jgi:hypothetical protein
MHRFRRKIVRQPDHLWVINFYCNRIHAPHDSEFLKVFQQQILVPAVCWGWKDDAVEGRWNYMNSQRFYIKGRVVTSSLCH